MTPEEMRLDMLVAELDYENRLLRARNERLEKEAGQRKPWVGLTDAELADFSDAKLGSYDLCLEVESILREKNQ